MKDACSVKHHTKLNRIRLYLNTREQRVHGSCQNACSKLLLNMMLEKAEETNDGNKLFDLWLSNKKSTVHLRDILCKPFKEKIEKRFKNCHYNKKCMVFDNAWMALDSASASLKYNPCILTDSMGK